MADALDVFDTTEGGGRVPFGGGAKNGGTKPRVSLGRGGSAASGGVTGGGADGGVDRPRDDFSRFVFEALLAKYGLRSLARQKHQSLLQSLAHHMKQGQGGALLMCTRLCGIATTAPPMGPHEEVSFDQL